MSEAGSNKKLDIVIELPFECNSIIDFNQLAEEKYGFEAIHPNVAIPDDLLVDDDVEDQDENDDDDEDGARDQPASAPQPQPTVAPQVKKPKRMIGKYDLNDPFIDDAEMEWESQAAATRDGFFVYSGVIEREKEPTPTEKEPKKSTKRKKESSETPSTPASGTVAAKKRKVATAPKRKANNSKEGGEPQENTDGNDAQKDQSTKAKPSKEGKDNDISANTTEDLKSTAGQTDAEKTDAEKAGGSCKTDAKTDAKTHAQPDSKKPDTKRADTKKSDGKSTEPTNFENQITNAADAPKNSVIKEAAANSDVAKDAPRTETTQNATQAN